MLQTSDLHEDYREAHTFARTCLKRFSVQRRGALNGQRSQEPYLTLEKLGEAKVEAGTTPACTIGETSPVPGAGDVAHGACVLTHASRWGHVTPFSRESQRGCRYI